MTEPTPFAVDSSANLDHKVDQSEIELFAFWEVLGDGLGVRTLSGIHTVSW